MGPVTIIPNGLDIARYDNGRPRSRGGSPSSAATNPQGLGGPAGGLAPGACRQHPGATLVVIGIGRARCSTDAIDGVDFRGRVSESEKRRLLGEASIMAAPNLGGESFGLVLVEAMASGCAVVASDIPAFRAVVGDAADW